jgi:predicted Zn-dependent peptidase
MTAMRLTTLDSGLRVASHPCPICRPPRSACSPTSARALSRRLERHRPSVRAYGVQGRRRPLGARLSEAIEEVGGDLNAATERDATSFTATVMAEHVPLAVELIADMILRPHFADIDLEREKQVVFQELAEARDTPSDMVFDELWSAAFEGQASAARSSAKNRPSPVTVADLCHWRDTYYRGPAVTWSRPARSITTRWSSLPSGISPPFPAVPSLARTGALCRRHPPWAPSDEQAQLTLGFPGPSDKAPDYYAARLFSDVVGSGASSRLFQQVREDRGLAYSISATLHPYADTGLFYIYAATARSQAAAALRLIEEIVAGTPASVTQRELDRVRTQARAGLLMSLETPWGQAHYVARQLSVHGRLVDPGSPAPRAGDNRHAGGPRRMSDLRPWSPSRGTIGA